MLTAIRTRLRPQDEPLLNAGDLHSPAAYWPLVNGRLATYPPLERSEQCDIAVVGGGISGAILADRFAADGLDVVLLDRRDVGSGSTAASTALLQFETDESASALASRQGEAAAVRVYELGRAAVRSIARIAAELPLDCGFEWRPALTLASRQRDTSGLQRDAGLLRRHGFDVEFVSAAGLSRSTTIAAPAAMRSVGSGTVDPQRLTIGLLARAASRGARIYDRTAVRAVEREERHAILRTSREATVRARRVILATGYDAWPGVPQPAGREVTTFAFASEPVAEFKGWTGRELIWETARPYIYLRTTADGRVIMGGEDRHKLSPRSREKHLIRATRKLLERFGRMFPDIPLEVSCAWAGTFSDSPDGLPYIGACDERGGVFGAFGYGGNGITFSVIAADILFDLCRGVRNHDADLFRLNRSSAGPCLLAQYCPLIDNSDQVHPEGAKINGPGG